jgi:hypothetical protein
MSATERLIEAACNYVQFLDPDSVEDQQSDATLYIQRLTAEHTLINAVAAIQQERGV